MCSIWNKVHNGGYINELADTYFTSGILISPETFKNSCKMKVLSILALCAVLFFAVSYAYPTEDEEAIMSEDDSEAEMEVDLSELLGNLNEEESEIQEEGAVRRITKSPETTKKEGLLTRICQFRERFSRYPKSEKLQRLLDKLRERCQPAREDEEGIMEEGDNESQMEVDLSELLGNLDEEESEVQDEEESEMQEESTAKPTTKPPEKTRRQRLLAQICRLIKRFSHYPKSRRLQRLFDKFSGRCQPAVEDLQ